jgi:C4-dicarboxylate-specific signal transduction histidine kinase
VRQLQLNLAMPPVQADRVQFQQVVLNLIINAVEAMSGSNEETRHLMINTDRADSNKIGVAVQDSGPGVGLESIQRIFDPFYTKGARFGNGTIDLPLNH